MPGLDTGEEWKMMPVVFVASPVVSVAKVRAGPAEPAHVSSSGSIGEFVDRFVR